MVNGAASAMVGAMIVNKNMLYLRIWMSDVLTRGAPSCGRHAWFEIRIFTDDL